MYKRTCIVPRIIIICLALLPLVTLVSCVHSKSLKALLSHRSSSPSSTLFLALYIANRTGTIGPLSDWQAITLGQLHADLMTSKEGIPRTSSISSLPESNLKTAELCRTTT